MANLRWNRRFCWMVVIEFAWMLPSMDINGSFTGELPWPPCSTHVPVWQEQTLSLPLLLGMVRNLSWSLQGLFLKYNASELCPASSSVIVPSYKHPRPCFAPLATSGCIHSYVPSTIAMIDGHEQPHAVSKTLVDGSFWVYQGISTIND